MTRSCDRLCILALLFDGHLGQPLFDLLLAFLGQLAQNSSIMEVELVKHQDDMRMHLVIGLFFVASCPPPAVDVFVDHASITAATDGGFDLPQLGSDNVAFV